MNDKKTKYNDAPFVPCNDCSRWDDCQEQAYKEGYQQGITDFVEAISLPLTTEEDIEKIVEYLKEKNNV